jgi:hypothetical protein
MLSSTGTIQELYDPALEVTTQQQADEYLAALVARQKKLFKLGETAAVEREKRSISFWASFEDPETFARVNRLYDIDAGMVNGDKRLRRRVNAENQKEENPDD